MSDQPPKPSLLSRLKQRWRKFITQDVDGEMDELLAKSEKELCEEFRDWAADDGIPHRRYRRLCQVMAVRMFNNYFKNRNQTETK